MARVGLRENPLTPGQAPRHRQAAAGRDRQGAAQGRQAAHPRRAHRRPQRRRLHPPARPAQGPAGQGHHLDHDQPQAQRDRARSPTRSPSSATADHRDPRRQRRRRRRGPDHPGHGRPRPRAPLPRPHARHRRGALRGPRLDGHAPAGPQPRGHPRTPTSRSGAGEIVGIAGLMGAGRTELARSIFGRSYGSRHRGHAAPRRQGGRSSSRCTDAIRAGIAYVSEDRKGLGLNLLDDIKTSITSAACDKLARGLVRRRARGGRGRRAATAGASTSRPPASPPASASSRAATSRRSCLSKWMYTDPQLLILDEPTRGIDVGAKFEIYGDHPGARPRGPRRPGDLLGAARAARAVRPDLHPRRGRDHP